MTTVEMLRSVARGAGVAVALIGAGVLIGWTFDIPTLKGVFPHLSTMKANTALGMILGGISLSLLARYPAKARTVGRGCAAAIALIGALTLVEYLAHLDVGIDQLLFLEPPGPVPASSPGRMGINTALAFVLLGFALLLLDLGPRPGELPSQFLALAGGAIGLAALIGYLYGVASLYGIASYTKMALHTAAGFVLLSSGVLLARSDRGLMTALTSAGPGGRMGRHFLPAALILPVVLGWFGLYGHQTGLYGTEFGMSLLVTATMAVFCALAWVSAVSLNRADARLRESEARKAATLEAALDCIVTIDHRGRITEFNQASERVFGYRRADVMGREMAALLIPPELQARHRAGLTRYLATGEGSVIGRRLEMSALRADGTEFPVELTITRLPSVGPPMFTGFLRDITERRQLEDQLRQAQKMDAVGRLAGGIAHDFNNLLTVIAGRARFALERLASGTPPRRDLETIIGATTRAEALTRQLLAFGRKQMLKVQVLDLAQVVDNMRRLLERTIREDVLIATIAEPGLARVKADPTQIEQVIMNLVVNARDAMPQGGRLTIEMSNVDLDAAYTRTRPEVTPGAYVLLAVTDSGIGMDRATQARIFEPFFTTKAPGEGTGLGLATVYGIIKQSSGHIAVYSEPGIGTTFKVYLPRAHESSTLASPELSGESTRGAGTILLVEDEDEVRGLAHEILESEGYTVLVARSPDEALRAASRHTASIHLVLTDVVMPAMSGPDLVERLRAARPDLRVVYMSGYAQGAMVHQAILAAGRAFVQKPFTRQTLTHKVREVLAG
jgi:PAS domain S-box-containing protein